MPQTAKFINHDGECVLEAKGTLLTGHLGNNFTAATSVEIGDGPPPSSFSCVRRVRSKEYDEERQFQGESGASTLRELRDHKA